MSFLFGKKNKQQPASALPPATRDLGSSHGPASQPPAPNASAPRDADKGRPALVAQGQSAASGASANGSFSSLQNQASTASPEPKALRERSDSDYQNQRGPRNPQDSPYPWSSRRLNFTTTANPFPRYGAAINSTASKDGIIYIMGGLVGGATVRGDLWMTELGNGSMACYPISTTGDGPGPRVGHASLLVGNAFIVFGGDTKLDDNDELDDTLYLLNTSTKHWSRALPQGPRPTGRYGHTLNILGSKIYIFGGQVEGFFFNDLVAFDLNSLQSAASRWEVLLPNTKDDALASSPQARAPPARTNHSVVTWSDKLYLFGGTDGNVWFNDVWTYDPQTNSWTELECIGYIPVAREGHSAALVNDTMYIFGGRTQDGVDLGDLAAFRISSRRWYMFQNMGHSPSARSGHSMTAFGKHVVVLAGEPSSSASDRNELSLAYVLDTSKIRYPPNETGPPQSGMNQQRKLSGSDRSNGPLGKSASPPMRENAMTGNQQMRGPEPPMNGVGPAGSRLPRAAGPPPSGPPPVQQPPQPRVNGPSPAPGSGPRSKTPTKMDRGYGPPIDTRAASFERENISPTARDSPSVNGVPPQVSRERSASSTRKASEPKESMDTSRSGSAMSRNTSKSHRQQHSLESIEQGTPTRPNDTHQRNLSREAEQRPMDSGVGASPALGQQHEEMLRELEAAKSRNAWYASELALARKAGYSAGSSTSPILDQNAADVFGDDDRPLLEALFKMKNELERVQTSIKAQGNDAAKRIAEVERQRDAAVSEAIYAKAKLAAHGGGSQSGTPQPDGTRSTNTPDMDRINDINRRLAASLAAQAELSTKLEKLTVEAEGERKAKQLADETAEAAQRRVQELDSSRQKHAAEFESLRAELYEAQRQAREASATAAEAEASSRLLAVDKNELSTKHAKLTEESKGHTSILQSLRDALAASSDKSSLLEQKLEEERSHHDGVRQKLSQLRAEHEDRTNELELASRKLRDAEELAEKHAEEARLHREAVVSGLGKITARDVDEDEAMDQRVQILQQQVEVANALVRTNQAAADQASEKLRRAEERIAGLEAYQEQSSREGLGIRKQMQQALRDMQASEAEKAELHQHHERLRLESNAFEVQLKTLKNLLEERGVNPVDARRSRVLDSPNSRFGTPELNRVRELEQQIDSMNKAHDELRQMFEQREHDVSKEWEEKLQALVRDHQAASKYLRGTEKMLTKMKQELDRYKNANNKLEEELARTKEANTSSQDQSGQWNVERESLRNELSSTQEHMKSSVARLEEQLATLQSELTSARQQAEAATKHASDAEALAEHSKADAESLRRQKESLEQRAREAEERVQLFLDQFETSVDNYRRQSQLPMAGPNGQHGHHRQHDSIASAESLYSDNDGSSTPEAGPDSANPAARNSMALDSLASELESLRSHWETTNKAFRLSNQYDFERTPTSEKGDMGDSLSWRNRMDMDDEDDKEHTPKQSLAVPPSSHPAAAGPAAATSSGAPAGPGGSAMI